MARLVLSEFVEPELSAIWDYIAIDNPDAADRFLEAAYATFQELARMPGMGHTRTFPQARLRNTTIRSWRWIVCASLFCGCVGTILVNGALHLLIFLKNSWNFSIAVLATAVALFTLTSVLNILALVVLKNGAGKRN